MNVARGPERGVDRGGTDGADRGRNGTDRTEQTLTDRQQLTGAGIGHGRLAPRHRHRLCDAVDECDRRHEQRGRREAERDTKGTLARFAITAACRAPWRSASRPPSGDNKINGIGNSASDTPMNVELAPRSLNRRDHSASNAPNMTCNAPTSINAACTVRRRSNRRTAPRWMWVSRRRFRDASDERATHRQHREERDERRGIPRTSRRNAASGGPATKPPTATAPMRPSASAGTRRVVVHHDAAGSRCVQPLAGPGQQSRADEAPDARREGEADHAQSRAEQCGARVRSACGPGPRSVRTRSASRRCPRTSPRRSHPGSTQAASIRPADRPATRTRARCHREHRLAEIEKRHLDWPARCGGQAAANAVGRPGCSRGA